MKNYNPNPKLTEALSYVGAVYAGVCLEKVVERLGNQDYVGAVSCVFPTAVSGAVALVARNASKY